MGISKVFLIEIFKNWMCECFDNRAEGLFLIAMTGYDKDSKENFLSMFETVADLISKYDSKNYQTFRDNEIQINLASVVPIAAKTKDAAAMRLICILFGMFLKQYAKVGIGYSLTDEYKVDCSQMRHALINSVFETSISHLYQTKDVTFMVNFWLDQLFELLCKKQTVTRKNECWPVIDEATLDLPDKIVSQLPIKVNCGSMRGSPIRNVRHDDDIGRHLPCSKIKEATIDEILNTPKEEFSEKTKHPYNSWILDTVYSGYPHNRNIDKNYSSEILDESKERSNLSANNEVNSNEKEKKMESKMSNNDIAKAIVNLANVIVEKDDLEGRASPTPFNMKNPALQEAIAKRRESEITSTIEASADALIALDKSVVSQKNILIEKIREIRRQEKALLSRLSFIEMATAYGTETNNFVPLAIAVDVMAWNNSDYGVIPSDWIEKYKADKKTDKKPVVKKNATGK